jgi:hypothetical protein
MTFKKKIKQKNTRKKHKYRMKGGDDWYCRCTDTTKSTPSSSPTPKPTPPPSQFASAKKALADAEKAKKAEVKPTTPTLAPPPKVTPPPTPKPTYAQAVKNPPPPPSKPSNPSPCNFKADGGIKYNLPPNSLKKVEDLIKEKGYSSPNDAPRDIVEAACKKVKNANKDEQYKQDKQGKQGKQGKSKKRSPTKKKKSRKPMLVIF